MFWPPAKVYRLKLELLYELSDEEEEKLHKYGKVKEKLSREIIVPEKMTLHALHYAIQRAFGWQNSHLHHFSLDSFVETENLERITGDQFSNWVELCGRYFRFPTDTNDAEEMDDLYWDEDYEETMSHKVWLRKKYTGPYTYNGIGEHLLAAQMKAKYFVDSNPMVRVFPSFQEYLENKGKEKKDEIKAVGSLTVREANRILESGIVELLERLRIDEVLSADKPASSQIEVAELDGEDIRKYAALITRYRELMNKKRARDMIQKSKAKRLSKAEQKILLMPNLDEEIQDTWFALKELFNKTDEKMLPIINKLYYAYDYGDGWEIAITCEEVYTLKTNWTIEEEAGNEWISGPVTDKQILEDYLVFDKAGESVTGPLRDTIVKACVKNTAKCLVVDGLNLMDDVGGIHMYCDFLEETATGSEEERTSNLTWAEGVGWTGKMPKAENLL